jgi:hypothetical protein
MKQMLAGFAQGVNSRSFLSARRRDGRLNSKTNSLLNLVDRPVRSRQGGFAAFSLVAATPPDPGGEFARLRMDLLCKVLLALLFLFPAGCGSRDAGTTQVTEVRIPRGAGGVGFLPLLMMEKFQLVEKHGREAGFEELKVRWLELGGPSVMNDALLSGSVDFIAAGPPAFLVLWDKTEKTMQHDGRSPEEAGRCDRQGQDRADGDQGVDSRDRNADVCAATLRRG